MAHDSFIRGGWQFVTRLLQNGRGIVLDVKSILTLEANLATPTIVAIVGRLAAPPKSQLGVKTSETPVLNLLGVSRSGIIVAPRIGF